MRITMTKTQMPIDRSQIEVRRLLRLPIEKSLPAVALLAHVTSKSTGEAFYEIAFKTELRAWKSVRVPKEEVKHYPAKVRDLLSKFDAALPVDKHKISDLLSALQHKEPPNWWQVAPALGWHADREAFVLPDRVLGINGVGTRKDPKLVPPDRLANEAISAMAQAGDIDDWKENVAAMASRSSVVTLALSAAFAAPLLSIINWPTFLIVLYGPGKAGKSTAVLAAATVLGIGHEKDLPNWNFTDAALAEIACCYNDLPLVLNGLESTKLKDKELRDFLKSVTYILGDGVETRRHSSWSGANGAGQPGTWRTIALVTSEQSFDEIAARASGARMDGERARAINVPTITGEGATIIDMFAKSAPDDHAERGLWARKQVEQLREACANHHGVALKPYLEHLMKQDRSKLREEIVSLRGKFVASVQDLCASEALNHAAKNFGVVYAGGVQAVRAGLLPMSEQRLLKRLTNCFKRSVQGTTQKPAPLNRGLALLEAGLQAAIKNAETAETAPQFTSTTNRENEVTEFVVHSTKLFSQWFGDDDEVKSAVLKWLCEQDLLVVPDRDEAFRVGFTIASVRHTRRIQGKSCASIVFLDPRPNLQTAKAA